MRKIYGSRTPLDEALEKSRNITTDLLRKHGDKTDDELKAKRK